MTWMIWGTPILDLDTRSSHLISSIMTYGIHRSHILEVSKQLMGNLHIIRIYIYDNRSSTLYVYIYTYYMYNTSSTAQGGGGSFKNRKPIGEIGCCESGMAERSH
jgi:hypothetical protein